MSRPLLQANLLKRSSDTNSLLRQSRSKQIGSKMNIFTEVVIQTLDSDVPYIAIYKPDIKKQQRRVQAITAIEKCMKKFELFRVQFALNKLNSLKHKQRTMFHNIHAFQQLFSKMARKRISQGFMQLATNKLKKKSMITGLKLLAYYEAKIKGSNVRQCWNRLKVNNYQSLVATLSSEHELTRQLSQTKNQLFRFRSYAFNQQFVEKSKTFVKLSGHNNFIQNIRQHEYESSIKSQSTRFQQTRSKTMPKKKDMADNEVIATAFINTIRAYQANIAQHIRYQQELKNQLQSYTNAQGISELSQIIQQKDAILNDIESFVAQITRMDAQIKRFSGQKYNSDKILSILSQQQKKLQVRSKKSQGTVPKLFNSRILLDSVIVQSIKRLNEQKQIINKQLNEIVQISNEENKLKIFIKKVKDSPSVKSIAEAFVNYCQTFNDYALKVEDLQSLKEQNGQLSLRIQQLTAETHLHLQNILNLQRQIKDLKESKEKDEQTNQNIGFLLQFINENQRRIKSHSQIDLSLKVHITQRFESIFIAITNILKKIQALECQKLENLKNIEQLRKKRESHQFSDVRPIDTILTPKKQKYEIRESELSLAQRFMSPLKQILGNRQEDKQLKHHILLFEEKFEEIINQNNFLREKLLSLQTSDKLVSQLTRKNAQLRQQNQNLKKTSFEYIDILSKYQQAKERLLVLTEQNSKIDFLYRQIADYELKIRQLSFVNAQLSEKIASLRESNSQLNNIATSNLQLSQKINQIYNKSTGKNIVQSNEQQLMRQTQLMQEILTLKIEAENAAIRHFQELSSLKNQINSYQTIISKLQADLAHRQTECTQKENTIQTLNSRYEQLKEINIELTQKIESFDNIINIETTKRFREDELQLNKLRQECSKIYEQLQITVENLRIKDNQLHSLQKTVGSNEEKMVTLKKDNERLVVNIQELVLKNEQLSRQNSRYTMQITQLKSQYHQIQLEYHKKQISHSQISHNTQVFQKQIQQKQVIINNLIEQSRVSNASYTSQLNQMKQEYISKQRIFEERLSDKDLKISKLEFQLNEKSNTITSLEQLISLYASNSESIVKQQTERFSYPYSRDKEIVFLRGQIKSLEQFLADMANQYQQLEKRYQQQRERANRAYLNLTPTSPDKNHQIRGEVKTVMFSEEHNKQGRFLDQFSQRFNHSFMSNINMTFTESDINKQLNRLMASNQSLANSVDYLRGENKQLFLKVKSISSVEMVLELVYNILLSIGRFKSDSPEGTKIWQDLCHLRSVYSGETLFVNLEQYCREFVSAC